MQTPPPGREHPEIEPFPQQPNEEPLRSPPEMPIPSSPEEAPSYQPVEYPEYPGGGSTPEEFQVPHPNEWTPP